MIWLNTGKQIKVGDYGTFRNGTTGALIKGRVTKIRDDWILIYTENRKPKTIVTYIDKATKYEGNALT